VHGYQWAHCCDDIHIVECSSNHFTLLMPHDAVAGDLDTSVVPVVADWLQRFCDVGSLQPVPDPTPLHVDEEEPEEEQRVVVEVASSALQAAPAAAAEVAPLPPPPAPFALPPRPRSCESWVRVVWAPADNLPVWAEEPALIPDADAADDDLGGQQGVLLPDLDASAGRLALGLNDLAWTASEAPTVVFILNDFLDGVGERWGPLVFATQLPVFGLHTPPGLLAQVAAAMAMGPEAPPNASMERLALQYYEAVRACLPAEGANCVFAGYPETAALVTELGLQTRMRGGDHHSVRQVVSVTLDGAPRAAEDPDAELLLSPAYQALYARVACASTTAPPSWLQFAYTLAAAGTFEQQLELVAVHRPPGVARASWDAEVDQDLRDTVTLFQLAEARMPCPITSSHAALLQDTEAAFGAPGVLQPGVLQQLQRKGSFARVLRVGRDAARLQADAREDLAAPAEASLEG
jgi:hypothetical protein